MRLCLLIFVGFILLAAVRANAQGPDYGLRWSTVGAPGNRATIASEVPQRPDAALGAVQDSFRITTTEITVRQWYPFVQAYHSYYAGAPSDAALTGLWIGYSPTSGYSYSAAVADWPIETTWYMAARYVNWLQNGQGSAREAFESGVYDTSTFHSNPDGSKSDQLARSPGANYFLPTVDEWAKATFFDPSRYGAGQPGYWFYPNRSQSPPISGLPGTGATTNAGLGATGLFGMAAGSYPEAVSPWGLLDTSGGASEWTETANDGYHRDRFVSGSSLGSDQYMISDRLDVGGLFAFPPLVLQGFRVGSVAPSPSVLSCGLTSSVLLLTRKRR